VRSVLGREEKQKESVRGYVAKKSSPLKRRQRSFSVNYFERRAREAEANVGTLSVDVQGGEMKRERAEDQPSPSRQ
jgi:hypothetical protein